MRSPTSSSITRSTTPKTFVGAARPTRLRAVDSPQIYMLVNVSHEPIGSRSRGSTGEIGQIGEQPLPPPRQKTQPLPWDDSLTHLQLETLFFGDKITGNKYRGGVWGSKEAPSSRKNEDTCYDRGAEAVFFFSFSLQVSSILEAC